MQLQKNADDDEDKKSENSDLKSENSDMDSQQDDDSQDTSLILGQSMKSTMIK